MVSVFMVVVVFFFKQKTAYEMRISDWSSDVCSSDLPASRVSSPPASSPPSPPRPARGSRSTPERQGEGSRRRAGSARAAATHRKRAARTPMGRAAPSARPSGSAERPEASSEEHTSELQSLMRISYAVFCLKKKKNKNTYDTYTN